MYQLHKSKPFYCTLTLLSIFFWYPREHGKRYKMVFYVVSGILRAISVLSALGTAAHAIFVVKDDTGIDISEDIGDLGGCAGCMAVCITFMLYHDKWSTFFNNLLDFKHFGKPPKYDEVVKHGNLISIVCIIYTIPGMLWYCFASYLRIPECQKLNTERDLHEACGMVNPTWLPPNIDRSTFLLFYFFQSNGVFLYIPSSFALCVMPLEAVEVIVARINHLKVLFRDAFNTNDTKLCVEQLNFCIGYHQDILRISKELSNLVRTSIGSLFVTSAFVIGSLGSQLLKESTPKAVIYANGYISALFFTCHAGQRLINESLDLTNYIYDSKWYEMNAKIKRDVVFVLARCQKPICLAAPPSMGDASYLLFFILNEFVYSNCMGLPRDGTMSMSYIQPTKVDIITSSTTVNSSRSEQTVVQITWKKVCGSKREKKLYYHWLQVYSLSLGCLCINFFIYLLTKMII